MLNVITQIEQLDILDKRQHILTLNFDVLIKSMFHNVGINRF